MENIATIQLLAQIIEALKTACFRSKTAVYNPALSWSSSSITNINLMAWEEEEDEEDDEDDDMDWEDDEDEDDYEDEEEEEDEF